MVIVDNLSKRFPGHHAVRGVSFKVEPGEVLGFLGPNGAGKTTTMRMITGFLPPSGGRALVCGHDVATDPVAARREIGYLPENAPAYGEMTVEGFLRFTAEVRGLGRAERKRKVDEVIARCFLESVRRQTVETLSKGFRQRTCFAQAILHDPPVLILDEPTEGLDPNQKAVVRGMIRSMGQDKVIILSTHVLEEVEAICSRAIIISTGEIVADDTPEALRRQSHTWQQIRLHVAAPAGKAAARFRALPKVGGVETEAEGDGACTLRIQPSDGQPILQDVLQAAWAEGWDCREVRVDYGRLDDVFRQLTQTEDVGETARKAS